MALADWWESFFGDSQNISRIEAKYMIIIGVRAISGHKPEIVAIAFEQKYCTEYCFFPLKFVLPLVLHIAKSSAPRT